MENLFKVNETNENLERNDLISTRELPASHLEGILDLPVNKSGEKMEAFLPKEELVDSVAQGLFDSYVEKSPGLLRGFTELCSDADARETFRNTYGEYVLDPESLKEKDPSMYNFMCDRIFQGREFAKKDGKDDTIKNPGSGENNGTLAKTVMYKYDMGTRLPDGCNSSAREGINVRCD